MMRLLAPAVLLLSLMIAPVQAQSLEGGLSVTAEPGPRIDPMGAGTINATVEVDCFALLRESLGAGGQPPVTVTAISEAFTSDTVSLDIAPTDCASGSGTVSQPAQVTLTPVEGAPGLEPVPVTIEATMGATNATAETTAEIGYRPGFSVTPDITFPATVAGDSLTFNVTLEYFGNARSMIMFEGQDCGGCTLTGLQPLIREPPATETLQLTFKPVAKDWDNATFEFRTFVHYLLESGDAGDPMDEEVITWRFVQAEGSGPNPTGEGNGSPGIGLVALLAAIVVAGAVASVRRR